MMLKSALFSASFLKSNFCILKARVKKKPIKNKANQVLGEASNKYNSQLQIHSKRTRETETFIKYNVFQQLLTSTDQLLQINASFYTT